MFDLYRYKGKRVLVTGHTGFKGSWMCQALLEAGAKVTGYALEPEIQQALFCLLQLEKEVNSVIGDIRDYDKLLQTIQGFRPEVVIHMAAQPIVRESYQRPRYTYETNVMGTVNVLDCIRKTDSVRSFVNVTTDKVYLNREWEWGYRENEELNGFDPYSNSKSCSELVTSGYRNSFFKDREVAVTTMRAGNVIGGGDFATDRIIPDCVRAAMVGKNVIVRNPESVRPYQHVLEPVMAYLLVALEQCDNRNLEGAYNVGPDENNCITTGKMAELFCARWRQLSGIEVGWQVKEDEGPHEAKLLKLDCAKMKDVFGWYPTWGIEQTVEKAADWYYIYSQGTDMCAFTKKQIKEYICECSKGNILRKEK